MSTNDPSWPSEGGNTPPPPPQGSGGGMGGGGGDATAGRPHASFGERAIALLIDAGIFFVAYVALAIVLAIVGAVSDTLAGLLGFLGYAVIFVAGIAYFILGEGGPLGQTAGKHMRGIQVVKEDGSLLDTGGALIRYLGRILDTIVCGLPIGYLWPLFDDQDRCWHDMIASTRVVTGGPQGSIGDWFAKFRG